jgi:hypothetical protein
MRFGSIFKTSMVAAAVLYLLCAAGAPAYAAAVYSAVVVGQDRNNSPIPVTASSSGSAPNGFGGIGTWNDFASAAPGELKSKTTISLLNQSPAPFGSSFSRASSAAGSWDDFIITGPTGSVSTSVNLRFTGTLAMPFGPPGSATATVTAGGDLGGTTFTGGNSLSAGSPAPTASGFLAGQTGSEITSPTVTLPVNVPFRLSLSLATSATVTPPPGQPSALAADADYSRTLAFSTQRPVFNLPAGYTANSAQALVVNNSFIVPEPATLGLAAPAALLALARRRPRAVR